MTTFKHKLLAIATSIGMLSAAGIATTVHAETSQSHTLIAQQADITDAQLREFATARASVEQIQMKYQDQAQNVTSEEQMQELQAKANAEMVDAVEQTNLSVEQYNQIASMIQTDQDMLNRYMELTR